VIGEAWFKSSPGKKLGRLYLKNKLGVVVCAYKPSYSGSGSRRIMVQDWPGQKLMIHLKNKQKAKNCGHGSMSTFVLTHTHTQAHTCTHAHIISQWEKI
jgi:hypothetical protein